MSEFTIGEIMFLHDVVKDDRERFSDPDVLAQYDTILRKMGERIDEYNAARKAINNLHQPPINR